MNPTSKDLYYNESLPGKIDKGSLSPYFPFRPHDVMNHNVQQSKKLTKSTIYHPMRCYLKPRFQMLRYKRVEEVIDTDIYFENKDQLKDSTAPIHFRI
jgi:hypothetical protein